jgi:hypothetical protein
MTRIEEHEQRMKRLEIFAVATLIGFVSISLTCIYLMAVK